MKIKNVITLGSRAVFHNTKFVWLMWALNAASALVLTVPIYTILQDNLSHSLVSERLSLSLDYFWFIQFRKLYEVQLDQMPLSIYSVVAIYTIIQSFFLGGLISIFHNPSKNHIVDFFYGGVKYFYRFMKVVLISIIFFAFAFKINDWSGDLITYFYHNSENVMMDFILKALRYTFLIFLIGVVTIISDYAKVSLAVNDKTEILKEIFNSVIFIKDNFSKVFITFLIVAVIGALGAVIYNLIGRFIPRTPYYILVISFILQQALIIFRLFIRMLFYSTEVILFKDLSAPLIENIESKLS